MSDLGLMAVVAVSAAGFSALLTFIALGYARRAMLDLPGRRRSHTIATPRGGGIGIVLTLLAFSTWLTVTQALPLALAIAFATGLVLVAAVGWIDDHRPLSPLMRLVVHAIAATLLVWQLPHASDEWPRFAFQVLLLVTAINFWNFMDGINGLIATQSAWVAAVAMFAFSAAGLWAWALIAGALGGACLGFVPFNFPRAKIFLGDVGSGGLGYACGAMLLLAESTQAIDVWSALIVVSALLLDAALTLGSRMLRGRRWYTAHREHLYQWLVRSGRSHVQTTWLYLGWNLIPVSVLLWFAHSYPDRALPAALACALTGSAVWVLGKRAVLERVKARTTR